MLTRFSWLWFSVLLCACSGLRCGPEPGTPPPSAAPPPDLRLFVLTDPKGYLEPCGCQQRPLGGVARLATALADQRKPGLPSLLVAAGDLLQGMEIPAGDEGAAAMQESLRADTLADVWRSVGMAAATPGPLDLAQPARSAALAGRAGFPWIVDNAADDARAALPLVRARLLDASGVKVGVLGVVAKDPALSPAVAALLDDRTPEEIARVEAKRLRAEGARVVVALVQGDRRVAREVAGPGVDVVVMAGLDAELPVPPALVRGSIVVHAGRQGQRLLTLDLGLSREGRAGGEAWHDESAWTAAEAARARRAELNELSAKLAEWEKAGAAAADLATQRARLAELKRLDEHPSPPRYTDHWFDARITELSPDVPEQPAMAALLDAYDVKVNEHNRTSLADKLPVPAPPGAPHYVGSAACASCHAAADAWWKGTPHGNAYATLERVHKQFNLSCVGCHVTGYNRPGGSTVTHVESLKNVGCESCHGPSSAHVTAPDAPGLVQKAVPEEVCKSCHTPEHSDKFNYDAYRRALIVPGHGLPKP
jgi:Cytochrome c554 and c-prime